MKPRGGRGGGGFTRLVIGPKFLGAPQVTKAYTPRVRWTIIGVLDFGGREEKTLESVMARGRVSVQ